MRNNNKLAYFIIAICTIWVLFSISKSYINDIKLNNYGIETIGRVIKFKDISKTKGFEYIYNVEGKLKKSESLIGLEENIKLGDFYKVVYLPSNTNIKKIYSDEKIKDTVAILKAGFSREDIENMPK